MMPEPTSRPYSRIGLLVIVLACISLTLTAISVWYQRAPYVQRAHDNFFQWIGDEVFPNDGFGLALTLGFLAAVWGIASVFYGKQKEPDSSPALRYLAAVLGTISMALAAFTMVRII